jgi:Uma2 family endonuclease
MIMSIPAHSSPQEYLVRERLAKDKHEYYDGEVRMLAGASLAHNRIVTNLIREIGSSLKDRPCEVLPSDIRVTVPSGKVYMYPDATIVCGTPEMEDDQFDTLKNPRVIFEVLSPSTAAHDRRRKFLYYQQIPSFQEYVLIDSAALFVEISQKQPDGSWDFEASSDPDGYLRISSVKMNIPLREVYRKVF